MSGRNHATKLREVPAFSVQSRQKNTVVKPLGPSHSRSTSVPRPGFGPLCAERVPLSSERLLPSSKSENHMKKRMENILFVRFEPAPPGFQDPPHYADWTIKSTTQIAVLDSEKFMWHKMGLIPGSEGKPKMPQRSVTFRKLYERGDFPIMIDHNFVGNRIKWKVPLEKLDVISLLPLFFDGLTETKHPYQVLAEQGSMELVNTGNERIVNALPALVPALRKVLDMKSPEKICVVLKLLNQLLEIKGLGINLVPFYRQLLPVLSQFVGKNFNSGDKIEYGQRKKENLGDLILETLQKLEQKGGPHSYINIKYMIPTYDSCMGYN